MPRDKALGLSIAAIDLCDRLLSLQDLIRICSEQIFCSPALPSELLRNRVGLLVNAYLDELASIEIDLKLTLEEIQKNNRRSEFEGVAND